MALCRNNVQLRGTEEMEKKKKYTESLLVHPNLSFSFFKINRVELCVCTRFAHQCIVVPIIICFTVLLPFMVILP